MADNLRATLDRSIWWIVGALFTIVMMLAGLGFAEMNARITQLEQTVGSRETRITRLEAQAVVWQAVDARLNRIEQQQLLDMTTSDQRLDRIEQQQAITNTLLTQHLTGITTQPRNTPP